MLNTATNAENITDLLNTEKKIKIMDSIKTGKFTLKGSAKKKKVNLINVVIRNKSSQPEVKPRGRNTSSSLSGGRNSDNSATGVNGCRSYNEYQSSM